MKQRKPLCPMLAAPLAICIPLAGAGAVYPALEKSFWQHLAVCYTEPSAGTHAA